MSDFRNTFNGKTVLVTGDTGFKGPWLCTWLLELGAKVIGFGLPADETSTLFRVLSLDQHIIHIDGDIRDLTTVNAVVAKYRPEFVFHMAAQSLVRASYLDPLYTFSTNIMGTTNILEAVRQNRDCRVVVNVTTDKVYANREWEYAYRENDSLGGHDPYSASKACADLLTTVYQQEMFMGRGVGVATVRAGNVYGGGDWAIDRLVPDIVRSYQRHEPMQLRNPGSVRPWQYVLEPLSGYLLLASELYHNARDFSGAWNFGPETTNVLTVGELVQRFMKYWPEQSVITAEEHTAPREANLLRLDWTKSGSLLGWFPTLTLDEGLERTAAWYLSELEGHVNFDKAVDYIEEYTKTARSRAAGWTTSPLCVK